MTKLKCWRKTRDDRYAKVFLHKSENLGVSVESPLKALNVKDGWTAYYGNRTNALSRSFKNKSSTLKFSNKYMKEHNKC